MTLSCWVVRKALQRSIVLCLGRTVVQLYLRQRHFFLASRAHGCFSHLISGRSSAATGRQTLTSKQSVTQTLLAQPSKSTHVNRQTMKKVIHYIQPLSSPHILFVTHSCLFAPCSSLAAAGKTKSHSGWDISERVCPVLSPSGREPMACSSHWGQPAALRFSQYCLTLWEILPLGQVTVISHIFRSTSENLWLTALQTGVGGRTGFRELPAVCWFLSDYKMKIKGGLVSYEFIPVLFWCWTVWPHNRRGIIVRSWLRPFPNHLAWAISQPTTQRPILFVELCPGQADHQFCTS